MSAFFDLPRRIFLDSCTVQTLGQYGGYLYDGEPIPDSDRIHAVTNGVENLQALRNIFLINDRAQFEWIVSEGSMEEAHAKGDAGHMQWLFDIADHSAICLEDDGPTADSEALGLRLNAPKFNNISKKDKRLLQEAIALRCDAFLTVERRLPTRAAHIKAELGISILTPVTHWQMLKPYAALWC
jgi:hypothetical protein